MKAQATDWEKLCVSHVSETVIASRIHKEFSKLENKN